MPDGLIYNIRSFSTNDGPGIRTTVFLKGCPLRCVWCHNPESQPGGITNWSVVRKTGNHSSVEEETIGKWMTSEDVLSAILSDRPFFEDSGGGVTISGGEPLSQPDFCLELLKLLRKNDIHTALDTSGFGDSEKLESLLPCVNVFLFDLKIMDSHQHRLHTGLDNQLIHENFRKIYHYGNKIIVRIPLVEGLTDTEENLNSIITFLSSFPLTERIDLLPYHPIATKKYQKLGLKYPLEKMEDYNPGKLKEIEKMFHCLNIPLSIGG
jgi:pyruvate formate lyase activating enzyme